MKHTSVCLNLRRLLPRVSLALAASLLTFLGCEIFVRVYFSIKPAHRPRLAEEIIPAGTMAIDKELGWKTSPDHRFRVLASDASGAEYPIEYSTGKHGFRSYPTVEDRDKTRILVLGDSFTMAAEVSDTKTYTHHLSRSLDAYVFAYGTGGYGSLQEYMILDKHLDAIAPDCVVLQFCSNDFINNDYQMELKAGPNNNGMRRPYLQPDGEIMYALPRRHAGVRSFANNHSKLLYLILIRHDNRVADGPFIEQELDEQGMEHPLLSPSRRITAMIVRRMSQRCGNTPLYVFTVDAFEPYTAALDGLLEEGDVPLIPGVAKAISAAESTGECLRARDHSHWNEAGHRVAAEVLTGFLATRLRNSGRQMEGE